MSTGTIDEEWVFDVACMDEERFPKLYTRRDGEKIKPSGDFCARALRLKDSKTVFTGWHHNPVSCLDEIERKIMERPQ